MSLFKNLSKDNIIVDCDAIDKNSLLKIIAENAIKNPDLKNISQKKLLAALRKREELVSTGIGKGIAVPHCSFDNISEFVIGIITIPHGIDFDSLDGKKAKLFIYIISPESKRNEHIRLLSHISKILSKKSAVDELLLLKDQEKVHAKFLEITDFENRLSPKEDCFLFHINVQLEDKFEDLLQMFAEMEDCFEYVVDVNDATYYLHRLPLFANFWSEHREGFNKLIIATVNKSFANETIRRINTMIDELDDKSGIMMTVQKLFYFNGSLNI
ncbi:MAG: PTS sugar transporter subunit IIA [Candidatus Cloacimonadota bacterium]|nr:PTS sugar transporter subunit IIA [Candidatus Cloacimonadota bacterium]